MKTQSNERPLNPYQDIFQEWQNLWSDIYKNVIDVNQQTLMAFMAKGNQNFPQQESPVTLYDPEIIQDVMNQTLAKIAKKPDEMIALQKQHLRDVMAIVNEVGKQLRGETPTPIITPTLRDKRFKNDVWRENPAFFFMQQLYLTNAELLRNMLKQMEGLDPKTYQKLEFYTRQLIDALSPTNFPFTNPDVIEETYESKGSNLIQGFQNFLRDTANGSFNIKMADLNAFQLKKDIATAKGKVVFRNELLELIQYEPTTKTVYEIPLLIVPPWINKFYVFDLKPENSFIKWAVDQGFTIFMISWVNPDKKQANKTLTDYALEGAKTALDFVKQSTKTDSINVIGYCTGGVLLNCLLAYLKAKDENSVRSATLIAAPYDFKEAGDLLVYVCEQQLQKLEAHISKKGYLEGNAMVQSFNLLRANDLIWSFYVNNYLLGKDPVPFDMLYWNADAVRMPARMHTDFLRNMYLENRLMKPGGITIADIPIDLKTINMPMFVIAAMEDHIAPWKSVYPLSLATKGPNVFTLSGSGHVAGIFNHPDKHKYFFHQSNELLPDPEKWLAATTKTAGSWWPSWKEWMEKFSDSQIKARKPDSRHNLGDAPGTYVLEKSPD